jgi:phosphoribosylamine--glycine ligase
VKILVIGSGAREHTIITALGRDPEKHEILAAPGNAGISANAEIVALDPTNPKVVSEFATSSAVDLVIIGPEAPLVSGVANALRKAGIAVFGPDKEAAAIEGSKSFAKEVMAAAGVPTGAAWTVTNRDELITALDTHGAPYVVKADGLAAGKGVLVTNDRDAAIDHGLFYVQHGDVLVEEFLEGPEVSLFFVSDGQNIVPLTPAQDYKRAFDGDEGPNTGGMGAYSPLPWLDKGFVRTVTKTVAQPVIDELAARGHPFIGVLYCGLINTDSGIKVIEFNARFGDPETQVVLARLKTPLGPLLYAAATGVLTTVGPPRFSPQCAVSVVLASEGYPDNPVTGRDIFGLDTLRSSKNVTIAHAATAWEGSHLLATGGRVLSVIATGSTFTKARASAYETLDKISLEGSHYRTDIALSVSP